MVYIAHGGEPFICLGISNYLYDESEQIIRNGAPVCTRELKLPYQWALTSPLFKAPHRIPFYCCDQSFYIS